MNSTERKTMTTEKAIVIGAEDLHQYISEVYGSVWEIQPFCPDVDSLWTGLDESYTPKRNADGSIVPGQQEPLDAESTILIFDDSLFDPTGFDSSLIKAIATLMPHACVMVWSRFPENQVLIQERTLDYSSEDYPFWFINAETAIEDINNAYLTWSNEIDPSEANVTEDTTPQEIEQARRGIIVSVTSAKGGSGKSSTSILLASQLSLSSKKAYEQGQVERPLKVCIVDMDTRDGQIGILVGQLQPTALNIRVSPEWSKDVIRNNLIHVKGGDFSALLAPKRPRTHEDLPAKFYETVILELQEMFDVVILDTSVNYLDPLLEKVCYPLSDLVLLVTDLGASSVFGMNRWLFEVTSPESEGGSGIDPDIVHIIVNKSMNHVEMGKERIESAASGRDIWATIPNRPEEFVLLANLASLDKLLEREDVGNVIYGLASKVVEGYPLAPLIELDAVNKARVSPTAQAVPLKGKQAAAPEQQKRGFFRR